VDRLNLLPVQLEPLSTALEQIAIHALQVISVPLLETVTLSHVLLDTSQQVELPSVQCALPVNTVQVQLTLVRIVELDIGVEVVSHLATIVLLAFNAVTSLFLLFLAKLVNTVARDQILVQHVPTTNTVIVFKVHLKIVLVVQWLKEEAV